MMKYILIEASLSIVLLLGYFISNSQSLLWSSGFCAGILMALIKINKENK